MGEVVGLVHIPAIRFFFLLSIGLSRSGVMLDLGTIEAVTFKIA
jgi:hypothetical protein